MSAAVVELGRWRGGPLEARSYHGLMRRYSAAVVRSALMRCGGNRSHAARELRIERTYLLRLIRELGVRVPAATPAQRALERRRRRALGEARS